jgi:hypothetical protein
MKKEDKQKNFNHGIHMINDGLYDIEVYGELTTKDRKMLKSFHKFIDDLEGRKRNAL